MPSPFLKISAGGHVAALACLAAYPDAWGAVLAAIVANHAAIAAAGVVPRSTLLGPNLRRLPDDLAARGKVALTFDDGPDPDGTPRVLDALESAGARATFFLVGRRVERRPDLAAEIARRGHAIGNHTATHPNRFAFLGAAGIAREIDDADAAIRRAADTSPRWFRAPAGIRNPILEAVLSARSLRLASWTRRAFDTVERSPEVVARRLLRGIAPGDVLLLHDVAGGPAVTGALDRVLDGIAAAGLESVPLPDPRDGDR